ncbi:hypothetical protein CCACVL1_13606 [Corchorus capsularis]|uniref:F-box domain-containing protein n=1 Tax=Corchorus capsularis TaxID=210143 RepID=A0A1R3IAC8_COCAP|nr:hypothetical protein CCACVL1_13606 [Corchorus capsularis]
MGHKSEYHAKDRISALPDEVLILILSCMPVKEATRTSVLSRRWEKLWTFSPCLELDGSSELFNIQCQFYSAPHGPQRKKEVLDSGRLRYINWVNCALESYHACAVDKFRIRFDLNERYRRDIDEWVRFAFEKKVKRFELDLSLYSGGVCRRSNSYPLCSQTLPLPSAISLTSLVLKQVNVSDEVLDNLISNSPCLECLCVGGSTSLIHFRVAGPMLCLKYVEIVVCPNIRSLELHAANLSSFKYNGPDIFINFMNIPNLVELCIEGLYVPYFARKMPLLSTSFSQLQKLALCVLRIEKTMKMLEYPTLSRLKQLELFVFLHSDESLLVFSRLIKACPSLSRLALKLTGLRSETETYVGRNVKKAKKCLHHSLKVVEVKKPTKEKGAHHSLKVVEVSGFIGHTIVTKFCMYVIKNAIMLEKIIIDPIDPIFKGTPLENRHSEEVEAARVAAEMLSCSLICTSFFFFLSFNPLEIDFSPFLVMGHKSEYHAEDRISALPDEVLILILSCMPVKEAARTSVLSRRWEKLWTFSPCLELDGSSELFNIRCQFWCTPHDPRRTREVLDSGRLRYINWVNCALESYHACAVDKFRIRFDLNERFRRDIDEWVRFAFEKKVKRFELDLSLYFGRVCRKSDSYSLCLQTLPLPSSISLTSLILKQVNVSDNVLDNLISNSPFLECLCVGGSDSLIHVRVASRFLCLKHVEIVMCVNIKSLELHAANLSSFRYNGPDIFINFMNIPNLVELCIEGIYVPYFARKMPELSMSFSQLQKLALCVLRIEETMKRLEYPTLSHLKQLELRVFLHGDQSLLVFSRLIKACPSLSRLALELNWFLSGTYVGRNVKKAKRCLHHSLKVVEVKKATKKKSVHHSLKVVEVSGFIGHTIDTKFCSYVIKNAIMLEKIIIDPIDPVVRGTPHENRPCEKVEAARVAAEKLRSKYFLGDKLILM